MIQERNIVTCIILSIITCGIYGIYWEICLVNDLNGIPSEYYYMRYLPALLDVQGRRKGTGCSGKERSAV